MAAITTVNLIGQLGEGVFHNNLYTYCVPKDTLESWLKGIGYDNKEEYSEEEKQSLKKDVEAIYQQVIKGSENSPLIAHITAGSPGAGKSYLINELIEQDKESGRKISYICPDSVCLQMMKETYQKELNEKLEELNRRGLLTTETEKQCRLEVYNKWRPASNALAHLFLALIINDKMPFYFGTTSSGKLTSNSFKFYKKRGYNIHVIHITAPDDVRWKSVKLRDKEFVQSTENDISEKGLLIVERINDTFLQYANTLDFYYREKADGKAFKVASWMRTSEEGEEPKGHLEVYNIQMYEAMKHVHNETVKKLAISKNKSYEDTDIKKLFWENSVEAHINLP